MLIFVLCRYVLIVKDYNDLSQLYSGLNAYLAADVDFSLPEPVQFKNGFFDCIGHEIAAYSQLFGAVEAAMIRNCTFRLQDQFADTIGDATLTNVTIILLGTEKQYTDIAASAFHGVSIHSNGQFARKATDTEFVGCAFGVAFQSAELTQSFINKTINCSFFNTFVNATAAINRAISLASLTISADDVRIVDSRFVSNFNLSGTLYDSEMDASVSGCMKSATGNILLQNSDFALNLLAKGTFYNAGGVVAEFAYLRCGVYNISSYFTLSDAMSAGSEQSEFTNIGGLFARAKEGSLKMKQVSAFNDIRLAHSVGTSYSFYRDLRISGLIGLVDTLEGLFDDCFVFGCISVDGGDLKQTNRISAAGCVAQGFSLECGGLRINRMAFSGDIEVKYAASLAGFLALLGGLLGGADKLYLYNSSFVGDISFSDGKETTFYVGALAGVLYYGAKIASCYAAASIFVFHYSTGAMAKLGGIAGSFNNSSVLGSLADGLISITYAFGGEKSAQAGSLAAGLLAGEANGKIYNCSAQGAIEVLGEESAQPAAGCVGGAVGSVAKAAVINNTVVIGQIKTYIDSLVLGAAFGSVAGGTADSIVVAVDFQSAKTLIKAYNSDYQQAGIARLFVDCGRAGNDASQEFCRDDLTTGGAVAELGDAFAWDERYNGRYPYLKLLPVINESYQYVLPDSGDFSADSYYVDETGLPFPKVDFQPCRGVCYGVYSSPVTRACENDFEYCIDVDRAEKEFPNDSCIAENAVCGPGASFCNRESELLKDEDLHYYSCYKACPGCYNGYCDYLACVCDIYNTGASCTYNCRSDTPNCFGDENLVCDMRNSTCIITPVCDITNCIHGSCSSDPIPHCVCENYWEGERCDICSYFGNYCEMTRDQCAAQVCSAHGACEGSFDTFTCNCDEHFDYYYNCSRCERAMDVIDNSCACGAAGVVCGAGFYCELYTCQKDCTLLDSNCINCDRNYLSYCAACGEGFYVKNGVCKDRKKLAITVSLSAIGGCAVAACIALAVVCLLRRRNKNEGQLKIAKDTLENNDGNAKDVDVASNSLYKPLSAEKPVYTNEGDYDAPRLPI